MWRNTRGASSESLARLSSLPICLASAGFQPASRPCASDRKGDDGRGAIALAGRTTDAMDLGLVRPWPEPKRCRSTFAPPDARPRGTGRNRQGRRVTAEAVGRLSMHVTAVVLDQGGDGSGPAG